MNLLQMQRFGVLLPDDPMETDAERRTGQVDDIDIDIDLAEEQHQDLEDEYMGEDITTSHHNETGVGMTDNAYNDNEMADDGRNEQDLVYEASIQDEDIQDAEEVAATELDEDDEIIDVVNDEPSPTPQIQAHAEYQKSTGHVGSAEQSRDNRTLPIDWEQSADRTQSQQHLSEGQSTSRQQKPLLSKEHEAAHPNPPNLAHDPQQRSTQDTALGSSASEENDNQQQHDAAEPVVLDVAAQALAQATAFMSGNSEEIARRQADDIDDISHIQEDSADNDQSDPREEQRHGTLSAQSPTPTAPVDQCGGSSKAMTHVHPVIVVYQGAEISLFRPVDGDQEFFLEDETLADASLADLLTACRPILGEDVSEQELVIRVDDLDLQLNESANDTLTITVSQIIDMYLQFQRLDGLLHPPGLRLSLFTEPSFRHRLDTLRKALGEGKGLSQVRFAEDGREAEQQDMVNEDDKLEYRNDDGSACVLSKAMLQEQNNKGNRATLSESHVAHTPDFSATEEDLVSESDTINADGQPSAEQGHSVSTEEHSTQEVSSSTPGKQLDGQFHYQQADTLIVDRPMKNESKVQRGQEPVLLNDLEEIVDFDDRPSGPNLSSASSTLRGDVEELRQSVPLSGSSDPVDEEVHPEVETKPSTKTEPLDDPASHLLDRLEATDDLSNAKDGLENTITPADNDHSQRLEEHVRAERSLEESRSHHLDDSSGGNYPHRNEYITDGDYKNSFEGEQKESPEYRSEGITREDVNAVVREEYIEDPADLDQTENDTWSGIQHLQGDKHPEKNSDNEQSLVDLIHGPETIVLDEDGSYEYNTLEDSDAQGSLHPVANIEENDEITFDDEGEDDAGESRSSSVEQGHLPTPGSLKRSRGHADADDADDANVEGFQGAKRTRST